MKPTIRISHCTKKTLAFAVTTILLWAAWFFCYPYFLRWLEGFNFFSSLPDFSALNLDLPGKGLRYVASFLLQFFGYPAAGAAIMAILPLIVILSSWCVIRRLFKESDSLLWLAFLPLPFAVNAQMGDITLVPSVAWAVISVLAALAVHVVTIFVKARIPVPGFLGAKWLSPIVSAVIVCVSVFIVWDGEQNRRYEEITRLEYLADNQEWDEILKDVSRTNAIRNDYKRRYLLLALSEKGMLADYAFTCGLSGSGDFVFSDAKDPLQQNFNMAFYHCLGVANPVIYYAYQQSLQSVIGLSSRSLRYLADTYLELGDYTLARKYMDILGRSGCNRRWVEKRQEKLESIKGSEPEYVMAEEKLPWGQFLPDMTALAERHPENRKYADYMLCSLLADRHGFEFYEAFKAMAPEMYSERIPVIYQQALLMFIGHKPEELVKYNIDQPVMTAFMEYTDMLRKGMDSQARRKYAGTYWAYLTGR